MNPGGQIPNERVLTSIRLFAERVAPGLALTPPRIETGQSQRRVEK